MLNDSRSEFTHYQDTGCPDLAIPSCLSCPLPACRYSMQPKQAGSLVRMMQVRALSREGLTRTEIGERMGLSARTVSRLRVGLRTWGALLPEVSV